jgi:hypothetical protein
MKKIIFTAIAASLLTSASYAYPVSNYQQAVRIISNGKPITFVVNFDKCQIVNNHNGKLTGTTVVRMADITTIRSNQISATVTVPTGTVPDVPELGTVYQTSTWTFDNTNHFNATLSVLNPVTYANVIPPTQITCDLGVGVSIFA